MQTLCQFSNRLLFIIMGDLHSPLLNEYSSALTSSTKMLSVFTALGVHNMVHTICCGLLRILALACTLLFDRIPSLKEHCCGALLTIASSLVHFKVLRVALCELGRASHHSLNLTSPLMNDQS